MLNLTGNKHQYRYYRTNSSIGSDAYDSLCFGLKCFDSEIKINEISSDRCETLISYISDDDPLVFQAGECAAYIGNGYIILKPHYLFEKNTYHSLVEEVKKSINQTINIIASDDEWDTLINLHAFILSNWEYKDFGYDAHTVVGPAIHATGVCQGIARCVKLICDYLGIDCIVVSGTAVQGITGLGGNHSWNAIKLSGEWYYFDFTFDLTMSKGCPCAHTFFDYFAISKSEIDRDHFDASVNLCSGTKPRDYFSERKLIVSTAVELEKLLERAKSKDVYFKIDKAWKMFDFDKEMEKALSKETLKHRYENKAYEYSWNDITRTYYIRFV